MQCMRCSGRCGQTVVSMLWLFGGVLLRETLPRKERSVYKVWAQILHQRYSSYFNYYRSIYWNLWCGKKERWFQMAVRNSSAYFPAETGNKYGVGKCPFDTREMVCHKICFFVCSYILKDSVYTLCIDLYIGICSECYFERCWICDPTADRCWNCGFSWVLITVWLWFKYSLIMVLLWFVMTLYDKLRRRWTRKSSDCCSCCVDVAVQTGELFVKEAVDISPRYAFS